MEVELEESAPLRQREMQTYTAYPASTDLDLCFLVLLVLKDSAAHNSKSFCMDRTKQLC